MTGVLSFCRREVRLQRGVFRSVPELIVAIEQYIATHNQNPKPFVWTAKANDMLQKVIRANRQLGSKKNEACLSGCHRQPLDVVVRDFAE